ncbi:MAG: type II secretion system F family protein [Thermofilum sp.]|nr:type II secretion system F family protein [Thermofilum sp.]
MPFIAMTLQRKVLFFALGLLLAAIPVFFLAVFLRNDLLYNLRNVGGVYVVTSTRVNVVLTLCVALALVPYTVVEYLNRSFVDRVNRELPELFKGLAEALRSGLTVTESLRHVAETFGGKTGNILKNAVMLVELGLPLPQALERSTSRFKMPTLERAASIISTAYESGGRVIDVLETSSQIFDALRAYEDERLTALRPHMVTIYVATLLYVILALTILYVFVIPLSKLQGIPGAIGKIDPGVYTAIMYYAGVMIAFFGGILVGKMRYGKASAGLVHSVIQLSIVVLSFYLAEMLFT